MKFSINKSELAYAIGAVIKGVSNRSTLPVLSGILFDAREDQLLLQTTDGELSIKCAVSALVEEPGQTVVPAKVVSDVVKSLPDVALSWETRDDVIQLSCGESEFSLKTLNPIDFPAFPAIEEDETIEIPFDVFATMVKRVAKVCSKDETRPIFTGVLVSKDGVDLKMVATDSYRLALTELPLEEPSDNEFEVVIPGSFLLSIVGLSRGAQTVRIGYSENQIVISFGDTVFINRRLEGTFPNYRQLLPENYELKATLPTAEFNAAVRRVALMSSKSLPVRFDFNKDTQSVLIKAQSPDVGTAQELLNCQVEGENMEIAFNFSYLGDGLSSFNSESIVFEAQNPLRPGVFQNDSDGNFRYMVMPVRVM